jgi:hypothetical protein
MPSTTTRHKTASFVENGDVQHQRPGRAGSGSATATGGLLNESEMDRVHQRPSRGGGKAATLAGRPSVDTESTLEEQRQDGRLVEMRAEMGAQFIDNLQIKSYGDLWIPGHRVITEAVAKEFGLAGFEDDPFQDMPLDEPQPASGAVDGKVLAAFTDGVTGQQKNDVLNCLLLAQLAANYRFDRYEQAVEWTKFYVSVLENIGWLVPQFAFRRLSSSQARSTIDAAVLKILQAICSPGELEEVQAVMDAVKALEDGDRRLVIFETQSHSQVAGNFQVNAVGASQEGTLGMKLGAFGFKTDEYVTKVLWFNFPSHSTTVSTLRTDLTLNEQVYERLRQPILDKLGARAAAYVGGLALGEA